MKRLADDFLEPLWVDPCADEIWKSSLSTMANSIRSIGDTGATLEPALPVDAVRAQENLPQPDGAPYVPERHARSGGQDRRKVLCAA